MPMLLYRILISLAAPVLWVQAMLRGALSLPRPAPGAIWCHAASLGELKSLRPVLDMLRDIAPQVPFLITTTTPAGRALLDTWDLPGLTAAYAPPDLRLLSARILRAGKIRAFVVVENELWPNRMAACHAADVPVILLAARLSDRSARRWARFGGMIRPLLSRIAFAAPQDRASAAHLVALGLPQSALGAIVDLKSLYQAQPAASPLDAWPRENTVLAAATHDGEEQIVIAAYRAAAAQHPDLRLIIAPRHPARAKAIAQLLATAGLVAAQRSANAQVTAETQVYLADTLGEMPIWYGASSVCLVGGSLVPKGGHTPFEPAAYGCAILHGPQIANFADAYARLAAADGAVCVHDAQELAAGWLAHRSGSPLPDRAAQVLRPADPQEAVIRIARIAGIMP